MRIGFVWVALLAFAGCRPRGYNAASVSQVEVTPRFQISTAAPLFSWTDDPQALSEPDLFVKKLTERGAELSRQTRRGELNASNRAGHGLYVAAEPWGSQSYGSTVVMMRAKPEKKVLWVEGIGIGDIVPLEWVRDVERHPVIRYPYINRDARNGPWDVFDAIVLREASFVDMSSIRSVSMKRSGPPRAFAEIPPIASRDIIAVLEHYKDHWPFLAYLGSFGRAYAASDFENAVPRDWVEMLASELAEPMNVMRSEQLATVMRTAQFAEQQAREPDGTRCTPGSAGACATAFAETLRVCLYHAAGAPRVAPEHALSAARFRAMAHAMKLVGASESAGEWGCEEGGALARALESGLASVYSPHARAVLSALSAWQQESFGNWGEEEVAGGIAFPSSGRLVAIGEAKIVKSDFSEECWLNDGASFFASSIRLDGETLWVTVERAASPGFPCSFTEGLTNIAYVKIVP